MFKKSLAAVALLGAFAGSAFAADVTLYALSTKVSFIRIKMRTKPILMPLTNLNSAMVFRPAPAGV